MGYILPVPFYQYQDYQERVTRRERNPYFIEQPFKVILDSTYKNIEKREDIFDNHSSRTSTLSMPREIHKSYRNEKVYSELTGKGGNFSESV